jgi:hypothetical protein
MIRHRFTPTRHAAVLATLLAAVAIGSLATMVQAAPPAVPATPAQVAAFPPGDLHDWDYNMGSWTAVNHRLKKRWTTNPEWQDFPATTTYVAFMGGLVNVDDTEFPTQGWGGTTVRVFDKATHRWSIYWISSRTGGALENPVVGGFKDDVGTFYGEDADDGVPVKVRFLRIKHRPDGERWEQAFSRDGGATWETNWTADFSRVPKAN